jgi:uncharacterized protein YheU (UPF0270 family)
VSEAIEIPFTELSQEALQGLIEEFIMREGTDYGEYEYSLDDKVTQIKQQLSSGKIYLVFDPAVESCTLRVRG